MKVRTARQFIAAVLVVSTAFLGGFWQAPAEAAFEPLPAAAENTAVRVVVASRPQPSQERAFAVESTPLVCQSGPDKPVLIQGGSINLFQAANCLNFSGSVAELRPQGSALAVAEAPAVNAKILVVNFPSRLGGKRFLPASAAAPDFLPTLALGFAPHRPGHAPSISTDFQHAAGSCGAQKTPNLSYPLRC